MHVPPLRFLKLSRYELDFKDSILFSSIYGSGARFVDVHQGVRLLEFERASKIKSLKTPRNNYRGTLKEKFSRRSATRDPTQLDPQSPLESVPWTKMDWPGSSPTRWHKLQSSNKTKQLRCKS